MGLNRKQKKQLDVARKKLNSLRQQLAGAKAQPDDPADVPRLEGEIEQTLELIRSLKKAGEKR
ncbi:MAG: hypothetical protein VX311_06990 [Planctomycetota bacterium]|jgi:hypothetical protein|nr:hypothetical protein [Planctomycetota bacterium]MED5402134.1 hypothetical protein [Planctomycetota bacterium]MED5447796.1 hypothetical protein [Planctomycetota bacterium]MEE3284314.1 hypothetical protein [Planctomycetota bacterium]MEE3366256.1 hypothetical protein [Planctomycetota bacterium]|tara:strand:- start:506 stop:694 length:189 start_codon:yes stop_codon:yes gene_type:complete